MAAVTMEDQRALISESASMVRASNQRSEQIVANRILRSLEPQVYEQLLPHFELVRFPLGRVIHEPGQPLDYVYFPNQGVLSMLTVLENGEVVEIATIGNEGMADLSVILGLQISSSRLLCQVPGESLRMKTDLFLDLVQQNAGLRIQLGAYMVSMFILVSQSAACNRLHPIEERCARWILMTHDRVDSDTFPLTQDFLASMLGVRRPSVSVAAGILQRAGLVSYSRGRMVVVDREGLEAAACECYAIVRNQFDGMPGGEAPRPGRRRLSSGFHATDTSHERDQRT
jgi:CRP-like cAMP-binding protein